MKKLLLLLFLIPNLVMAETWVCVYEDGSIAKYTRSGDVFMLAGYLPNEIIFENDEYIHLSNAKSTGKLGYSTNLILNKKKKTMLNTENIDDEKKSWSQYMNCEVVK